MLFEQTINILAGKRQRLSWLTRYDGCPKIWKKKARSNKNQVYV